MEPMSLDPEHFSSFSHHILGFESIYRQYQDLFLCVEKMRKNGTKVVVGVVATCENGSKILLVENIDRDGIWSNPAGHVEINDTIHDAIAWELLQEADLSLSKQQYSLSSLVDIGRTPKGSVYLLFAVDVQAGFYPMSLAPSEIGRSEWFTLDRALELLRGQGEKTFQPFLRYLEGEEIDLAIKIQQFLVENSDHLSIV